MKTDYYVLLNIDETATSIEIKKAYRKKALLLHPDKNPDDIENTTRLFNEVRVAYETLSDPQERSWYDSHKFQILMEDGDSSAGSTSGDYNDDNANTYYAGTQVEDIQKYFNVNLYQRMDDSISGFYSVVSVLLDKIASEEVSSGKQQKLPGFNKFKDDTSFATVCDPKELMYPRIGNSKTDFESTKIFYKAWSNFQSVKTFGWCDEYRYSTAPDRRTRRLMEKENKKLRDVARKSYNDSVRNFIAFIKKMDPRMDAKMKKEYEKQKLAQQREEMRRQAQIEKEERQRQRQLFEEQEWQTVDPDELAEIEAQLDKIHQEEERLNGNAIDDDDELEDDIFECVICDKLFKSEKQFQDHERSKRHLKTLKQLQWEMRKEGIELGIDDDYIKEEIDGDDDDCDVFDDALETLSDLDELTNEELELMFEQQMMEDNVKHAKKREESGKVELDENPRQTASNEESEEDSTIRSNDFEDQIDNQIDDDIYGDEETFKSKTKTDDKLEELSRILNGVGLDSDDDDDWGSTKKNSKEKKGKKNKQRNIDNASSMPSTGKLQETFAEKCSVCEETFTSRNRLFQHVNSTGHAAPPSKVKKTKKKKAKK